MSPRGTPRSRPEWVTFGASLALVAAVIAAALASGLSGPEGPPAVSASRAGPVERVGESFRVPFEVRNGGGDTAADVQVTAELRIDGRLAGEGEQSFAFLSGGETESGAFVFSDDPAGGTLTIGVASYADP